MVSLRRVSPLKPQNCFSDSYFTLVQFRLVKYGRRCLFSRHAVVVRRYTGTGRRASVWDVVENRSSWAKLRRIPLVSCTEGNGTCHIPHSHTSVLTLWGAFRTFQFSRAGLKTGSILRDVWLAFFFFITEPLIPQKSLCPAWGTIYPPLLYAS